MDKKKYEKFSKANLLKVIQTRKQTFKTLQQHFGYVPTLTTTLRLLEKKGLIRILDLFNGRQRVFFVKADYNDSKINSDLGFGSIRVRKAIKRKKQVMKQEAV